MKLSLMPTWMPPFLLEALVDNGEAHEVGQFGLERFSEAALILFLMALGHCMIKLDDH